MQNVDAVLFYALVKELQVEFLHKRVDKIFLAGKNELIISFRGKSNLLINANAKGTRICKTQNYDYEKYKKLDKKDLSSSNFVVLLKKHLINAKLTNIELELGERIIYLKFETTTQLGDLTNKTIICELMGKNSNIILIDEKSQIIHEALHLLGFNLNRDRQIRPNIKYQKPEVVNKLNIFEIDLKQFQNCSANIPKDDLNIEFTDFIAKNFKGIGKDLINQILQYYQFENKLSIFINNIDNAQKFLSKLDDIKNLKNYKPHLNKQLGTFDFLNYANNKNLTLYNSFNELVDDYFYFEEQNLKFETTKEKILGKLKLEQRKLSDKLSTLRAFIENTTEIEMLKKYGSLIYSNLSSIELIDNKYKLLDFETNNYILIPIDNNLSPEANAEKYFKQYQKAKLRYKNYSNSLQELENRYNDILFEINKIEYAKKLEDLSSYFESNKQNAINTNPAKSNIVKFKTKDGALIYIGRNSYQNDELFSKIAKDDDYWFHVQGYSGAHVLLRLSNPKLYPPNYLIEEASNLAAKFSKANNNAKIMVVYTKYKFVNKISSKSGGQVRYEREKTIEVKNNWSLANSNLLNIENE